MDPVTDIIVETKDPEGLDKILKPLSAYVCQSDPAKGTYVRKDGGYVVRCFANVELVEAAIKDKGLVKIIKRVKGLV